MISTQQNLLIKKRTSLARKAKPNYCDSPKANSVFKDGECEISKCFDSITPRKSQKRDVISETDISVSPPKQKCYNDENAILSISPKSPSYLINQLSLKSPKKICADLFTPKSLFHEDYESYQCARQALHSSTPTEMPAREKELDCLQNFINGHLENNTSGTLYVSGPPGTGKTAALSKILTELKPKYKCIEAYINCTSVKTPRAIYCKVVEELGIKDAGRTEKEYLNSIENHLASKHKPIILVLDEIDQLDSRKQCVLYTIFEWPTIRHSQLILIGIANALDLTDRILPRLQVRCELKPKLLHFAPYTKQQIFDILKQRLNSSNVSKVFSAAAMQLLAGKVSAVSGDMRRALDIGRRVIELAEKGKEETVLQSIENQNNTNSVGLKQVVSVLNNVYGTSQNLQDDVDDSMPLQQKLLLCSLILILKQSKNKDITIGRLHEVYRKVCVKRSLSTVDQSEFVGLCSLVESRGILRVNRKKEPRLHKVCLEWDEDEVASVLKDQHLMSSILGDASCLNK